VEALEAWRLWTLGGFGGMDALCPSYFGLYTANPAAAFRFGWEDVWRGSD
jgi:hypothetical protein